ncbi:MAG: hypothetical protein HYY84_02055 [Deltaproteobacteria bacterium]|nr:hypothetical protein [Deltaproteobacteria bacterium]
MTRLLKNAQSMIAVLFFAACTSAEFVDPNETLRNQTAVQSATVIYSSQENLTFAEWSFRADAPIEDVEILERKDGTWVQVDAAASLYDRFPACSARPGTRCLRHVVRGDARQEYQLAHPTFGVLRRSATLRQVAARTIDLTAAFALGNASLEMAVTPNARLLAARAYEWTIFAISSTEDCRADNFATSLVWKPVADTSVSVARTDRGLFCHGVRARDQRDESAQIVVAVVEMAPEVRDVSRTFSPEVRDDPLVVKVIHDENATPAGCARMRTAIDATLDAIPHTRLPTIGLSGAVCAMTDSRTFDANSVAYEMVAALENLGTANDEKTGVLLYASNVSYGAPQSEMLAARSAIDANRGMHGALWLVVPQTAIGVGFPRSMRADETVFWIGDVVETAAALRERLEEKLPTVTQRWGNTVPVPLLGEELTGVDGKFVKLCTSVPQVSVTATLHQVPVSAASPPTFTVAGIARVREPKRSFVPTTVRYALQVCDRYCDHAAPPTYLYRWNQDRRCFR